MSEVNENAKRDAALGIIEKNEGTNVKNTLVDAFGNDSGGGGSSPAPLVVNSTFDDSDNTSTLDSTWAEISSVFKSGGSVVIIENENETVGIYDSYHAIAVGHFFDGSPDDPVYYVDIAYYDETVGVKSAHYITDSEDGHPVYQWPAS